MPPSASLRTRERRPLWLLVIAGLWLCGVAVGLSLLWQYDNAPGAPGLSPQHWPSRSRLARATDGPTLVMLAHPQCSCTRASLVEFAEVLARSDSKPTAYVVFLRPLTESTAWTDTGLWRQATAIPGVTVLRDDDGMEAKAFAAATSGQTVLYDARGSLVFSGGVTGARAHEGDNAGRASLVALLNGRRSERALTSVFGCPLFFSVS